jgi:uncharacterized ferredoxin-like protein
MVRHLYTSFDAPFQQPALFSSPAYYHFSMTIESEAVKSVAGLMALSARTAPKAIGQDSITIEILTGKDQDKLANRMIKMGKALNIDFFRINGEQVKVSDATLLIGVEGQKALGANCGGCGYASCAEMAKAVKAGKNKKALYKGPNCVLKISDLGIAVGSAVKTASIHNVDNRIMFSAGVVALQMGMLKGCSVAYGIPLKASGKNIFWDMKFGKH